MQSKETLLPFKPENECTVLLVDDDTRYLDAFSSLLSPDGYELVTAQDGFTALQAAKDHQPDIIILDVLLPGKDGIEVCQEIKSWAGYLPIILVTGLNERKRRLAGLQAGADDFINKPLDTLELKARVRSLIRTKQLYDQVEASRANLEEQVDARTQELRQAYERLKELDKVKARILAIVSHELRTPLVQIKSALNLSRKVGLSDEQRSSLDTTLDDALHRLENRIDDISVYSDPTDLTLRPTSVKAIISAAVERVRQMQRLSPERIKVTYKGALPAVMVDATAMTKTLTHLIDNAVKFGNGKPVRVDVAHTEAGVAIHIIDQGDGIKPEELPLLFSPLQQGDDSSTREHPGLGLGLALVKMVLDAHKIDLTITPPDEGGTQVTITLPSV